MPDGPRQTGPDYDDDFYAWTHLSRSLLRDAEERLPGLYAVARKRAALDLQRYGEDDRAPSLPIECPYTIDRILAEDWYPDAAPNP